MQTVSGIDAYQSEYGEELILALGNFDGVHLGHRAIIESAVKTARGRGVKSGVLILSPHPLAVLYPEKSPPLLQSMDDRAMMLGEAGIDFVIIHPFTREFAAMPPESFAGELLHGKLGVSGVVVGFDYSFGRRGCGTPAELVALGKRFGFTVHVVDPVSVNGEPVGSTAIRSLLLEGRVEAAAAMLGYTFYLRGRVVHGDGRGRTLGFPTANVSVPCDVIRPANGVYLTDVEVGGSRTWALTNVGNRPTFCKEEPSVEVYLPDTEKNLYNQELIVRFLQKIREEMAFKSAAELVEQIQRDIKLARAIINSQKC